MKQVRRSVKQILFSLTLVMVFFINIHPVMAQEISNESKNAIWNEFEEKREKFESLSVICPSVSSSSNGSFCLGAAFFHVIPCDFQTVVKIYV